MRKVGLVGGISWVSTIEYYKLINEGVNAVLGGLNFAECVIYSVNFGDVQAAGWDNAFELLLNACEQLEQSGAESIALCANTAHLFADQLQDKIKLPLIHIVEETAKTIKAKGLSKVGLLGTKFTMEMDFYSNKLKQYGIEVVIPDKETTRAYIQYTVKEELGIGVINAETKAKYMAIVQDLVDRGAEGVILGCTEIPMLLNQADFLIPVFDTTQIHAKAIVSYITS
jgi:aspartate racemase